MRISLKTLLLLVAIASLPCFLAHSYLQSISVEREMHRFVRENELLIMDYREFNNHAPSPLKAPEQWSAQSMLERPPDWIAIVDFGDMPTTIGQIDELTNILRRYQQPIYQINFSNSDVTNGRVRKFANEFDEIFVSIDNEIIKNERRDIRLRIANQ